MRLLLVDDEPGIREGLAALLRRKGHDVVTADDCTGATRALTADNVDFDLVLTDWRLPDGVAESFLGAANCPTIAMSGHPEEVMDHPRIDAVMAKPVKPARLLEVIHSVLAPAEVGATADDRATRKPGLPKDVAGLLVRATHVLGRLPVVEDDGTFVTARAVLSSDRLLAQLEPLGGDQRVLTPRGVPTVELRWCRDGRPEVTTVVVEPKGKWPRIPEFAVDFDPALGPELSIVEFEDCLGQLGEARAEGSVVHFLNVPESLVSWTSDQGRSDELPMRTAVGPRLPAVLADLWS
ncbi:MAG: response regulator [bacterium]|nr:response regulator [bacterium]